jgi:hypothetical protein
MRFFTAFGSILLPAALATSSVALMTAATSAPVSPLEPIAFLVGGVWRGHLPAGKTGPAPSIELRCDWSANHQGIRFDSSFVVDGKRSPYTSGIYNWNPSKRLLVFVYSDAEGSLTEGGVTLENGALIHDFTVTDVHGKVEKARAIITPHGPNAYTNNILMEKNGSFERVVSVEYERAEN